MVFCRNVLVVPSFMHARHVHGSHRELRLISSFRSEDSFLFFCPQTSIIEINTHSMAEQSAMSTAMPDPPRKLTFLRSNKNLCESCKGINYESLTTPGGYKHIMTFGQLFQGSSSTSCDFCMFLKNHQWSYLHNYREYHTNVYMFGRRRIVLSINNNYKDSRLGVGIEDGDLGQEDWSMMNITTRNGNFHPPVQALFESNWPLAGASVTELKSTTNSVVVNNTPEASLQLVDRWFKSCLEDHTHCSVSLFPLTSASHNMGILGPKRLIDLEAFHETSQNARLIGTNSETSEYAALSYCCKLK